MQIDPAVVGTPLKAYHCTLTPRRSMNYAAAVQDRNPWYFDDLRPGGPLAPPMQAVSLTWPIFERMHEFLPASGFPLEVMRMQVHYSEHLVFHRPLKPGDDLTIRGRIAAVVPHRAGTHVVLRLDAFDAAGAPVFTEYNGGLLRGVACAGAGQGGPDLPSVPRSAVGSSAVWQAPIPIDPLAPFVYDGCTDIYFPIHTSVRFARSVGLPDIILQGTATLALAAREIINREAGGDPRGLKALGGRFSAMVLPGETITVQLNERRTDPGGRDLFFGVLNAAGGRAVNHGYARIEQVTT
jgi:acyl dehydratase